MEALSALSRSLGPIQRGRAILLASEESHRDAEVLALLGLLHNLPHTRAEIIPYSLSFGSNDPHLVEITIPPIGAGKMRYDTWLHSG